jgi:dTDP-4-amino-4,6-dideoxygalactose transaminase
MRRSFSDLESSARYVQGGLVDRLESEIRRYTGARHAIAVGNGTDALILALRAAGIGPGDEVVVPAFTFIASASSVAHAGARPVFADIDPLTYALDPEAVPATIGPRTAAIMPVHLFSQPADMPRLLDIAAGHGIPVIEDSAEGIGMRVAGRHTGLLGMAGVLSFFPTKTLGALGDAGMVLTDDDEIARYCREGRDSGEDAPFAVRDGYPGIGSRMDEIQATVLLHRLAHLDADIDQRRRLAERYDKRLCGLPEVTTPRLAPPAGSDTVYYTYVIEAERRDELVAFLRERGIGTETYYPLPLHRQPCFGYLGHRPGDFPVAERACQRTVALPLYPDLADDQVDEVCAAVIDFYGRTA